SREYRIPCVVGVGLATTVINTGDEIEVDGTKGVVTVFKNQ
ncbi:MAG: PEP-utilizing enzyme, partial [Candidatus Neomarinimicrobiota bacterium]|nr:PEP-utilizing enzyme [Candidatus Neomarinimicrobiota bacterium]